MPEGSTGGRSGKWAIGDRLPPVASIVLRRVEVEPGDPVVDVDRHG
ncbi:MAG: hypothetical protein OXI22_21935 [Defluviicoccus sp.]|nr:hypothetical protein [Defluviicoccus sp.]MDE0386555.1 hypothetical protein [Defluviicoccus sp.]